MRLVEDSHCAGLRAVDPVRALGEAVGLRVREVRGGIGLGDEFEGRGRGYDFGEGFTSAYGRGEGNFGLDRQGDPVRGETSFHAWTGESTH